MVNNELWIIYALVFGAALLGFQALYWLVFRSRAERKIINRRLALSSELSDPVAVLDVLRRERGLGNLGNVPGLQWLDELVMQTGWKVNPVRIFVWIAVLSGVFYLPLAFWLKLGPLAIVMAVAAGLLTGYLILRRARARRIGRFSEQLPEALDIVVRGLRAGHPFRVALGLVARELPDPIGTEFGILIDEISLGADQQVAVDHLAARVGQEDLTFVSIAINIQSQTGGNLAEILQGLSRVLRNRSKLRLKVRALTSEGRLSGIFMTAMPFILFVIVSLISPNYFAEVRDHALVVPAVVAGLMLLGIGNFVIFRMVNFKF
ncbi:type II secretion system F family protein [Bradyrhizobium sp. AUGA SZCCT0169]|uniref:type II secretion system F family protein n=1 Tax=Bradyrhizobium sp. AUGA SZCCT0169 TaxID=2807663 RepID=UPI001BAC090B|nr:type II secretion system F family protein [Bradyrhizobium sp. AUGA SZCCT0169]MBR1251483.1 type II secretion system F family protein [Bradyrhizobium sp. AUGA SZCCT0169]